MPVKDQFAGTLLIDAHVHYHRCFAPAAFLGSAARNLAAVTRRLTAPQPQAGSTIGCLLFTEARGDHAFQDLRAGRLPAPGWRLEATDEDNSLVARGRDGSLMVLVAGRQITTREGLEVLALGHDGPFADGVDLASTVASVHAVDALPVLPWGFGKWWGRRGATLRRFLAGPDRQGLLFLGDNGGRPEVFPAPRPFALAARLGILLLPGSDPLPLAVEVRRVASYGLILEGALALLRPAAALLDLLRRLRTQPRTFGRRQALWPFLSRQFAMQWRKHALAR